MLTYVAVFLVLLLTAIAWEIKPFQGKMLWIAFGLILAFIAGFRAPGIDKDYENYESGLLLIEEVYAQTGDEVIPFFEPAFYLLSKAAKAIFPEQYVLAVMIFYAFASVFLKMKGIRSMGVNPFMILLLYFSQYFMLHEMTQIRIGLAAGMFFLALYYYCQGNLKAYASIIFLACFFHYSSVIYFSLLLVDRQTFNRWWWLGVLALSLILSFVQLPMLQLLSLVGGQTFSKVNNYVQLIETGQAEKVNTLNVLTLLNLFASLALVVFLKKEILEKNTYMVAHLKVNIISLFILSAMSSLPTMAFRLSELFGVISMFTFSYLVYLFKNRVIGISVVVFVALATFYITLFYGMLLKPYQNILFN